MPSASTLRLRFDAFELDEADARLKRDGRPVPLAPKAFGVLCALARQPGVLVTKNALLDLGSYRMPSLIPLTVYTAIVPIAGVLILLFTLEQLICGWQNGFAGPEDRDDTREAVL